jgi:hypothetical protein
MNKLLGAAITVAVLFAASASAFADGDDAKARITRRVDAVFAPGPRLSRGFDKVDADRHGYVSRAELTTAFERCAQR